MKHSELSEQVSLIEEVLRASESTSDDEALSWLLMAAGRLGYSIHDSALNDRISELAGTLTHGTRPLSLRVCTAMTLAQASWGAAGSRSHRTMCTELRELRLNSRFPAFETDIHGLVKGEDGRYHVDCVKD